MNKNELIKFETKLADLFDEGELPYLVHLCGGNEDQLIPIFENEISSGDYVFSTHRNHYHYLLAGGSPDRLHDLVMNGKSMFVFDRKLNFFSSSIVAGNVAIAVGVAWALKRLGSNRHVWCFVGDGAEDEGHFYEAVRYVDGWDLPCTFIIEDNDRSVSAPKSVRWGSQITPIIWPSCVRRYSYVPTWPHSGNGRGKWLKFRCEAKVPEINNVKRSFVYEPMAVHSQMKLKDAIRQSMNNLAAQGAIFVGYNVKYGGAYETLKDVSNDQKVETPVAENLMAGLAMGMTMEGFRPVLFFERHDFVYNATDALVNHIGIAEALSDGEFVCPVIVRAVAGSIKPFYAGLTHTSDLTELFTKMMPFPVVSPRTSAEALGMYSAIATYNRPVLVSELKGLYEEVS